MDEVYIPGFIYVLTNEAMPGLVKIGRTSLLPEDRSKKLYSTGVPFPFDVCFRIITSFSVELESYIHNILREYRVNSRREFFRISVDDAIYAVRLASLTISGMNKWNSDVPRKLTKNDKLILSMEENQIFILFSYENFLSSHPQIIDIWQSHSNGDQLEFYAVNFAKNISSFSNNDPYSNFDPVPFLNRESSAPNGFINGRETLYPGERLLWISSKDSSTPDLFTIFEAQDHVQIISRTWSPRINQDGYSLLLNDFLYDSAWDAARRAINKTLSLPFPRAWAPRTNRGTEWDAVGSQLMPPEFWLPQLKLKR
ncbi:GIY-YIG nuclease family protein [Citrobacter arsenatis]|uniref:GIY-YIG nuclease family protein n=1 Tax=Citrobacter arsenatis TaxID=2546350 RepID=A0A4P6WMW3_9ENTR|nr:GIY-YIG nuclease family protein [Citrobacter arsenatis]QBM24494.1 GIY-YIG nuclease family protein [Citrobacter arsenatis]